jgi:enamine deaminase RidA (YjgF/YER057c/UK114 family)
VAPFPLTAAPNSSIEYLADKRPRGPSAKAADVLTIGETPAEVRMQDTAETRLSEMGLALPDAPAPAANYVPYVLEGKTLWVSGQISQGPEGPIIGKLGADMAAEGGAEAARACALSLLAQVKAACGGDLGRLKRVVKLTGFVNSTPDFTDQPKVINGASDLMVAVLGDSGRHDRSAVSAASLPFGVAVEIEGVFTIE